MPTISPQVEYYLQRLRDGDGGAFHRLLEMDSAIIPELIAAFHSETDQQTRKLLVEVIWQHRDDSVIPFLGEVLHDPNPEVWKEAIDGLVTFASPQSLEVLSSSRTRVSTRPEDAEEFRGWIDEAIGQITNRDFSDDV